MLRQYLVSLFIEFKLALEHTVIPVQAMKVYGGSICLLPLILKHLTPNGHFSGRTAPLTYRGCIF